MLVSNIVPLVYQIKSYHLYESVVCHLSGVVFSLLELEDYSISQWRPQHDLTHVRNMVLFPCFHAVVPYDSLSWCGFLVVCKPDKPSSWLMTQVCLCLSVLVITRSSHCIKMIMAGDERSSLHSVSFCGTYSVIHLHHQISGHGFPSLPQRHSSTTTWWNCGFAL